MKRCFLILVLLSGVSLFAQNPADISRRSALNPQYAPFYHGVASGDPMTDRVILWTRITLDTLDPVTVNWKIALDTNMISLVGSGSVTTDAVRDYTVKVDAGGLSPGTWYYYRFDYDGRYSLVGRAKTAPAAGADSLRLGIVSCSHYESGWFNAYERITTRNDIDALIHLGDYIYEGEAGTGERVHEPSSEILSLSDYRMRLSQYKLDPDLRYAQQQYTWITVWDDHETSNNSWVGGAEGHDPGADGNWTDRRNAATQAYMEWMPVRLPDSADADRVYRRVRFGDLADLLVIDSRLEGRMEQVTAIDPARTDSARTLLGPVQLDWLKAGLSDTATQWKLLGNQVMMAPLQLFGLVFNTDQWDGYPAERERVYKHVLDNSIQNFVVLTGDIHCSWANDLPGPYGSYDPGTGANSAGVEFVTPSVTAKNADISFGTGVIQLANPHMKFIELASFGYVVLDVNRSRTQADWFFVNTTDSSLYADSFEDGWYVNDGERWLEHASGAAPGPAVKQPLAPLEPANPAIGMEDEVSQMVLVGVFPNPATDRIAVQFHLNRAEEVTLRLRDMQGRLLYEKSAGSFSAGLHQPVFMLPQISSSVVMLEIAIGGEVRRARLTLLK